MDVKPLSEKVQEVISFPAPMPTPKEINHNTILEEDIKATLKAFKDDILEGRYNCQHCGEGLDEITLNYLIKKHFGSLADE